MTAGLPHNKLLVMSEVSITVKKDQRKSMRLKNHKANRKLMKERMKMTRIYLKKMLKSTIHLS